MQSQSCVDLYTDETRTTSRASTSHLSHPPRATTSERSFRPRRVEPSVTDTDPAERRARARVFAASCCSRRAGRHPRRSSQRTVPPSLRASCVSRTTSVASPYADRKHLAATRQPAQMDGKPPPLFHSGEPPPHHREQGAFPPQQGASPPCFTAGVFAPQQGASPPSLHPRGSARNMAT